mmetsp:Transcript_21978/g.33914  ORF Transcript_21978/g.33914 Transcript_21978/m.33914 type:complete len:111 (+) Transcript_21978:1085-1417(+)
MITVSRCCFDINSAMIFIAKGKLPPIKKPTNDLKMIKIHIVLFIFIAAAEKMPKIPQNNNEKIYINLRPYLSAIRPIHIAPIPWLIKMTVATRPNCVYLDSIIGNKKDKT